MCTRAGMVWGGGKLMTETGGAMLPIQNLSWPLARLMATRTEPIREVESLIRKPSIEFQPTIFQFITARKLCAKLEIAQSILAITMRNGRELVAVFKIATKFRMVLIRKQAFLVGKRTILIANFKIAQRFFMEMTRKSVSLMSFLTFLT